MKNKIKQQITASLLVVCFCAPLTAHSTECSSEGVGPECGRPSNVRNCLNATYQVQCRGDSKTYHLCNTTWINFTASRQAICVDETGQGRERSCALVDFRCGYRTTGACQPTGTRTCLVGANVSMGPLNFELGDEVVIIDGCAQVDGSEPEEIPGGKWAVNTPNPACTPTPTPDPTPANE